MAVGERLTQFSSYVDDISFYRVGGDEFAFIIRVNTSEECCQSIGNDICRLLSAPYELSAANLSISATIGIALVRQSQSNLENLVEKADFALYKGKRSGRGVCTVFSDDLNAELLREEKIKQALRSSNFDEEIYPVFQPILNIEENEIVSFEAVARWKNPELGNVRPDEFIPMAEIAGAIDNITKVMIAKTLAAASGWPNNIGVSINISALDLMNGHLLLWIADRIRNADISEKRINLEITETALIGSEAEIFDHLIIFKNMGCGISVDDFGKGHSSLFRLHKLPLTTIKIDRSFISGIEDGTQNYKIVKSVLSLSRDMKLACVVEGVEKESEFATLKNLGARLIQGYYFSKPVEAEEVGGLLQRFSSTFLNSSINRFTA